MAIAMRSAGVTRGYKARTAKGREAANTESSPFLRLLKNVNANAREIRAFVADEIVYATMDTLRVWSYLRYELGFRTRSRVEPMVHDLEVFVHEHEFYDVGALTPEQARVRVK